MFDTETRFVIPTYSGLEELLAKEISQLGGRDVEIKWKAVSCTGDKGFMYKANFCLRTGLMVLPLIKTFPVYDEKDLFLNLDSIQWDNYLTSDQSFNVKCTISSEFFEDKLLLVTKASQSVVDFFQSKVNKFPKIELINPDVEILIYIGINGSILLNSSGESLSKRGYLLEENNEILDPIIASGIIVLSSWETHQPLIDLMCGAGVIPIEAALWAAKIPPGAFRKHFAFENWIDFDLNLFNLIRDKQIARIVNNPIRIYANEVNKEVFEKANLNIASAGVDDMIITSNVDFNLFKRPDGVGTILINPPFGNKEDIIEDKNFFSNIGNCFKQKFTNYKAFIFTGNPEIGKLIGLKAKKRFKLFYGDQESRLLGYDLFDRL